MSVTSLVDPTHSWTVDREMWESFDSELEILTLEHYIRMLVQDANDHHDFENVYAFVSSEVSACNADVNFGPADYEALVTRENELLQVCTQSSQVCPVLSSLNN